MEEAEKEVKEGKAEEVKDEEEDKDWLEQSFVHSDNSSALRFLDIFFGRWRKKANQ